MAVAGRSHALIADPSSAIDQLPCLLTRAGFFLTEGDVDKAFEGATAALTADPQSIAARYMLADIHRRRRNLDAAEQQYREVLQTNPNSIAAQMELASLQLTRGEIGPATEAAQTAARERPDSIEARTMLLRSLIAQSAIGRAERWTLPLRQPGPRRGAMDGGMLEIRSNHAAERNTSSARWRLSRCDRALDG